ncbi:hypothetical protein HZ326_16402 [Fusarium oxysporum f. sp. albedinis]|nr:hypothetical protein HZ326_16402 [Fusarium oxysporum f. sp. albedinis]
MSGCRTCTAHSKGPQMGKERPGQGEWANERTRKTGRIARRGFSAGTKHKNKLLLGLPLLLYGRGAAALEPKRQLLSSNGSGTYLGLSVRRNAFTIWSCTYVVEEFRTLAAPLTGLHLSGRRSKMDQSSFVYLSKGSMDGINKPEDTY